MRTRYLVIEQPEKCGTVWLAFSEHKWTPKTREQYENKAERKKRMQPIEPSQGGTSDHTAELTDGNLSTLIDYAPKIERNKHGKPTDCPDEPKGQISLGEDGSYKHKQLQQCITRYPWPVYGQTNDELKQQRQQVLLQAHQSMGSNNESKPMMMALWDAIGITHELNGYRNDPASWLSQYASHEQALRVTALRGIDQAKTILENGWVEPIKDWAERTESERIVGLRKLRARAQNELEHETGARRERTQFKIKQLDYLEELNRQGKQKGISGFWQVDEGISTDKEFAAWQTEIDEGVETRQANYGQMYEEKRRVAWSSYEQYLDTEAIDTFRSNYEALQSAVKTQQNDRTDDIAAWLQAPLFISTLEDYHPRILLDGVIFNHVIGEAIEGLASTDKGEKVLDELIADNKRRRHEALFGGQWP